MVTIISLNNDFQMKIVLISIKLFLHDPLTNTNNEETFIQDFLENQNF